MKVIKQIAKSKRVAFTALLNAGWLIATMQQLTVVKEAAIELFGEFEWAQDAGLAIVILATMGIVWTKLHDDKANQA